MDKIAVVLICFYACLHKVIDVVHQLLGQPSYKWDILVEELDEVS